MTKPFDPILNDLPDRGPDSIDLYMDDLLSPSERTAFEARLAAEPELRARLAQQREIDGVLGRAYAYEPPAPMPMPKPVSWPRVGWIASLASAVLLAVSAFVVLNRPSATKHRPAEAVYAAYVEAGWKPAWKCENDQQSADAVSTLLGLPGAAVIVPLATPGVEVLGWIPTDDYRLGTPISQRTLSLLTRVDGKNVLLLVDLKERDRAVAVTPASGLNVFRREVDGVVIYEVSPLGKARVLPFAVPAVPTPKIPRGSTIPVPPQ